MLIDTRTQGVEVSGERPKPKLPPKKNPKHVGGLSVKVKVDIPGIEDITKNINTLGKFILGLYDDFPEGHKLSKDDIRDILINKITVGV